MVVYSDVVVGSSVLLTVYCAAGESVPATRSTLSAVFVRGRRRVRSEKRKGQRTMSEQVQDPRSHKIGADKEGLEY